MKIDENNFIPLLKSHNEKALDFVVDQYGGLICSVVRRQLPGRNDLVEECVNDVLLAIWRNIDSYDPQRNSFQHWAAAIAKYKAVDCMRKQLRRKEENIEDFALTDPGDPFREITEQEVSDGLKELLGCLKEQDQELFYQLYVKEWPTEQVSKKFGLTQGALYSRLSRAKKKLRGTAAKKEVAGNGR